MLGTGGTLINLIPSLLENDLFVAHADNLSFFFFFFSLSSFYNFFTNGPKSGTITMMTFFCDDPSSCGIVTVDDKNVVRGFEEKPVSLILI